MESSSLGHRGHGGIREYGSTLYVGLRRFPYKTNTNIYTQSSWLLVEVCLSSHALVSLHNRVAAFFTYRHGHFVVKVLITCGNQNSWECILLYRLYLVYLILAEISLQT